MTVPHAGIADRESAIDGRAAGLVGAILLEQDDEWAVVDRRYFRPESMQLLAPQLSTTAQEILAAIA